MATVSRRAGLGRFMSAMGVTAFVLLALALVVSAEKTSASTPRDLGIPLDNAELNEELQQCSVVQKLGLQKKRLLLGADSDGELAAGSLTAKVFAVLFPGSPAVNALLATLYISGPPNFLLALCPTNIDPASLSVMVAFAVGGLLGDTLFHLLPEIFVGEDDEHADRARLVLVEPNRNLLLGVAILVGFLTFVAMDKALRIATGGGDGHDHGHSHNHSHSHGEANGGEATGKGSAASTSTEITSDATVKSRKKAGKKSSKKDTVPSSATAEASASVGASASVKLSGYLNLIADFTHNITDGLAMSASFYASPTIGATTTVAVFFHEIPHEVGDFALLVQSGFSKRAAMGAQFITAVGALLGTVIGILVQEFGGNSGSSAAATSTDANATASPVWDVSTGRGGLLGTSLSWGDLLLPFTAGTFLYVGTVAVIPELLETELGKEGSTTTKALELRKTLVQFAAIAAGAGIMLYISWQ